MKQNRVSVARISGWILLLLATGICCLQIGFLYLQKTYHVAYIDERLFYIFQIVCVLLLGGSLLVLLHMSKKWRIILISFVAVFVMVQSGLMTAKNNEINQITSISPNLQHTFSVKENLTSNEATYYRSYYYLLSRPHTKLPHQIRGESSVEWVADDVAVFTYEAEDNSVQQFVGTYGDRKQGMSYYYVGAEMQGEWEAEGIKVESTPDGIFVTENNQTELFDWEETEQFGTLAIVLKKQGEAVWTIALAENFVVDNNPIDEKKGNIVLYKANLNKEAPKTLKRIE